jgi:hypothetical protein
LTVQEETPAFAFYPNMPGDVVLGHQWSSETYQGILGKIYYMNK